MNLRILLLLLSYIRSLSSLFLLPFPSLLPRHHFSFSLPLPVQIDDGVKLLELFPLFFLLSSSSLIWSRFVLWPYIVHSNSTTLFWIIAEPVLSVFSVLDTYFFFFFFPLHFIWFNRKPLRHFSNRTTSSSIASDNSNTRSNGLFDHQPEFPCAIIDSRPCI